MKKCDICGELSSYHTELFDHLASREVKTLCYTCADIVGKYCDKVRDYAEAQEASLVRRLQAQVDKQRKEEIKSKGHWLAISLRAWFQRSLLHSSFELGIKKTPDDQRLPFGMKV